MAFDIYLTIPNIDGESVAKGFPNAIEVFSYSWGLSVAETITSKGAGKPQLSDFSFLKRFDKSSPLLMQALVTGDRLKKATVSLVKSGAGDNLPFLTYEFDVVLLTSIQDSASTGGDDFPIESISFAMEKVIVTYRPQTNTGVLGNPISFEYNINSPGG